MGQWSRRSRPRVLAASSAAAVHGRRPTRLRHGGCRPPTSSAQRASLSRACPCYTATIRCTARPTSRARRSSRTTSVRGACATPTAVPTSPSSRSSVHLPPRNRMRVGSIGSSLRVSPCRTTCDGVARTRASPTTPPSSRRSAPPRCVGCRGSPECRWRRASSTGWVMAGRRLARARTISNGQVRLPPSPAIFRHLSHLLSPSLTLPHRTISNGQGRSRSFSTKATRASTR